jgi:hypothetical protein
MDTPDPPPVSIDPKPFKIPLTLKDVPPGSALRRKGGDNWGLITYASEDHVVWDNSTGTYEMLMEDYEIKVPGGFWTHAHKWDFAV